jgi:hypothetical protein
VIKPFLIAYLYGIMSKKMCQANSDFNLLTHHVRSPSTIESEVMGHLRLAQYAKIR